MSGVWPSDVWRFPTQNAPGMPPQLRGECGHCGLCCVLEQDGERFTCQHLVLVGGRMARLGTRGVSHCRVYAERSHLMPIVMHAPSGREIIGRCAASGTPEETAVIIAHGVGRGCTLEVA